MVLVSITGVSNGRYEVTRWAEAATGCGIANPPPPPAPPGALTAAAQESSRKLTEEPAPECTHCWGKARGGQPKEMSVLGHQREPLRKSLERLYFTHDELI